MFNKRLHFVGQFCCSVYNFLFTEIRAPCAFVKTISLLFFAVFYFQKLNCVFCPGRSMSFWQAAEMSSDSQRSMKGEAATMQSPSVSASTQGPPLSPSSATKPPELPGNPICACHFVSQLHLLVSYLSDLSFLSLLCLTDELVQAGWSKCWSRRENRPYYFNRFTNQSLWEVPVLGQHDVIVSDIP